MSKDLYENAAGFKEAIEPDAAELASIRNHLEHKYLKLHEGEWAGRASLDDPMSRGLVDSLAFSVYRRVFEDKTLRLLKMARCALIYLSLAIHSEELQRRRNGEGSGKTALPIFLDVWEDRWKV